MHTSVLSGIVTPYPRDLGAHVRFVLQNFSITRQAFKVHVPKATYSHTTNSFAPLLQTENIPWKPRVVKMNGPEANPKFSNDIPVSLVVTRS